MTVLKSKPSKYALSLSCNLISLIPAGSLSPISLSNGLDSKYFLSSCFDALSSSILLLNNDTETGLPPKFPPEP